MSADRALRRSRLKLMALIAVFVLPMLVAWVMVTWRIGIPEQRTAHGRLAPTLPPLVDWPLAEPLPVPVSDDWVLAFDCGSECEAAADRWWRVHRALGREGHRVRRLRVGGTREALPGETVVRWSAPPRWSDSGRLWVLDPGGRPVLAYSPGVDPEDVLDDIEALLRMNPEKPVASKREVARR